MNSGKEIAQRIKDRASELELPIGTLMEEAGLHYKYLDGFGGKNGPTVFKLWPLKKILKVSWDWLIEGIGDAPSVATRNDEPAQVQIRELDIRLAAGPGEIAGADATRRTWGLPQSFLYALSLRSNSIDIVEIVGNSMYPLLWPGDLVLVDRSSVNPDHRAIYAVSDGDAIVCKWVERDRTVPQPSYLLTSENPDHQPYRLPKVDARIVGRVVWFGRRL